MKVVTSVLMLAASAGLALLALTTRREAGDMETVESVDRHAAVEDPTRVPAAAESWFV